MDIGKGITYVTEDERWLTKLGIATVIMLISSFVFITIPLLIGFQLGIMRNVMKGSDRPLPEWDDLGRLFMDGLNITIALIVFTLPLWLLACIGIGVTILPILGADSEGLLALLGTLTAVSWLVIGCLFLLLLMALFFITPAVMVQYVRHGTLAACFRFGEIMTIVRDNLANIVIVAVVSLVANLIVQSIAGVLISTFCLAVIGLPLAWAGAVWILAVTGHLYGQMAKSSKAAALAY